MTAISVFAAPSGAAGSVFASADVCREAGLNLPEGVRRPLFEDDLWDLAEVVGLPISLALQHRRFNFALIHDRRWRLVAKELIMALLAPGHEAVASLPRAYRATHHVSTCHGRLAELIRFAKWLTGHGVTSLQDLSSDDCDAYLAHRRYQRDQDDVMVGERGSGTRRLAALIVTDLLNYRELFTADRVPADLRPWGGATPSAIAEDTSGNGQNKTPPANNEVLQPMLAAALHLVNIIGPQVVVLAGQVRAADQEWSARSEGLKSPSRVPLAEITEVLAGYERAGRPLPEMQDRHVQDRIKAGWSANDPLAPIALSVLIRQAGFRQFHTAWLPHLRAPVEATLKVVGSARPFGWDTAVVDRADDQGAVPWTLPLHKEQASALAYIVRTACILVLAATTGMRASELMELKVGCRRPPEQYAPGLVRYRLASKLIKGQPLGGTHDEWVVIDAAYQAVALAEQLHNDPSEGAHLFGRFHFGSRYQGFRQWVNNPAGQRLGLSPIPEDRLNMRMLRRRLAIELAYRPGGLLAAKIHLRHVSTATTEGYASRPGGAQAELLAEVSDHEQERNLALVLEEFRNYQAGILPAGPGARDLTEFFAHVDAELAPDAAQAVGAPRVQASDRDVLNLLTKRARTLHLGAANYCWFVDPARALCLKLAGTPHADKPLAGMCDSARCPQATHHPCHRPVWADHTDRTKTFLGGLGATRKTERTRLQIEYDRSARVLAEIDAATTTRK
ncbi:integrase [Streptosporangium album]|uniref:Integrase n=1 Tax=Streptosporangium album TaxID=47479 RepID=A0A7W7WFB2_9ACTN|nr:site-specific integrase [Streptosporangium album]MBB4944310.1 integrase [Streptosporangium album]